MTHYDADIKCGYCGKKISIHPLAKYREPFCNPTCEDKYLQEQMEERKNIEELHKVYGSELGYSDEGMKYDEAVKIKNDIIKEYKTLKEQIGGDHYKNLAIQPAYYSYKNKLRWHEGEIVKYITRHRFKNGVEDLYKAAHLIEMLIELEYGVPINADST